MPNMAIKRLASVNKIWFRLIGSRRYKLPKFVFKLKQSMFVVLFLTFENSNQIKLLQIASNCIRLIIWLKQDKIGSIWIKLDQIGSNWIKLDQIGIK